MHHIFNPQFAAIVAASFGCVTAACVVDLLSALFTARQLGIEIRSARLRYSIEKLGSYMLPLALVALLDLLINMSGLSHTPWCSLAIAVAEVAVEARSVFEHTRRRRNKAAKMPEQVSVIADWIGRERLNALVSIIVGRLEKSDCQTSNDTEPCDA